MLKKSNTICLFGAGGHGKVVAHQLMNLHSKSVVFGDAVLPVGTVISDVRINYNHLSDVDINNIIITIGNSRVREKLQLEAEIKGYNIISFIANPDGYFAAPPKSGSVILAGAIVNINASIGSGVIVNSAAVVEHDVVLGNFSHISPGAVVTGGCELGDHVWVGAGAVVTRGISVASDVKIGAGAVVLKDIKESGVYVGIPAKKISESVC